MKTAIIRIDVTRDRCLPNTNNILCKRKEVVIRAFNQSSEDDIGGAENQYRTDVVIQHRMFATSRFDRWDVVEYMYKYELAFKVLRSETNGVFIGLFLSMIM